MAIDELSRDIVSSKVASPIPDAASRKSFRHLPRGVDQLQIDFVFIPNHYLKVPDEYLTASRIRGKLPTVELQRSHTDLGVGDVCFFLTMRCFNDAMFSNS